MPPPKAVSDAVTSRKKPLYLFADSQLLFWNDGGVPFLMRARNDLDARAWPAPRAAYLGASSGDEPAYYEIFVGAMEGIGVRTCRHIPATPTEDDRAFLDQADLILLAGGDVERGLSAFHASGIHRTILARHAAGTVLLGVSAGAVQLGLAPAGRGDPALEPLGLVPFFVGAHDEPDWTSLGDVVLAGGEGSRGIGVPLAGAAIVDPGRQDCPIEPVRKPLAELVMEKGQLRRALLWPRAIASAPDGQPFRKDRGS